MPRLPSDPVARLAKLEAARAQIGPDETFNGADMARVAGMTWRNMREIVAADPDFPVEKRGSEGVEYVFSGVATLDYMIAQARAVQADRGRRTDRASYLAGLGGDAAAHSPPTADGVGPGIAARELRESALAIKDFADARAKMRAERQKNGELLERSEVEGLLWALMTAMQAETMGITSKIDQAGQWEPAFRLQVEDALADVLVRVRARLEATIGEWDARGA
ncbi:MAG: hypothetical protein QOH47_2402 [Sphingomonadales bacterium]|jgi:hypothetical protein|nr:hypothetical protein [Sphingomonadales bacterium]